MKFRPILTDSTLQELTEHGSEDFPMSMDEQLVSAKAAPIAFHWHYEIQVVLATKGTILQSPHQGSGRKTRITSSLKNFIDSDKVKLVGQQLLLQRYFTSDSYFYAYPRKNTTKFLQMSREDHTCIFSRSNNQFAVSIL